MAVQKQDGGIRPILSEEIWRRCFASLGVNSAPVGNEEVRSLLLLMITLFKLQVSETVPPFREDTLPGNFERTRPVKPRA